MDYGEILQKSWKIVWKFKILWIFGFLASCGKSGGGAGGGNGGATFKGNGSGAGGGEFGGGFNRFFDQVSNYFEATPTGEWIMIAVGLFFLITILVLLTLALGTIGKIGLIRGVWKADQGAEKLRFGELLHESLPYFWRVILFTVGLTALGWIIGFLMILPGLLFTVVTLGLGLCCLIPFLILVAWLVGIFVNQAVVAIVAEDLGVIKGAKRAWQLIRENFTVYLVMGVIIYVGMAIVTLILMAPVFAIMAPFIIGTISSVSAESASGLLTGGAISLVLLCIYIPLMMVAGAILEAYVGTAWTLVFRRASGRFGVAPGESGVQRDTSLSSPEADVSDAAKPESSEAKEPPMAAAQEPQDGGKEDPQE